MSLVPISSFGKEFGVETPTIDAIIHVANVMLGKDFWKTGRTIETLGLKGMSVEKILKIVEEGM